MVDALLLVLLACHTDPSAPAPDPAAGPAPPETPAAPPATFPERFALLRADLDRLDAAHDAKDEAAVLAGWETACRQHLGPLIATPLRGRADPYALLGVEYGCGRLLDAASSPRPEPFDAALEALRTGLTALEQATASLPVEPG